MRYLSLVLIFAILGCGKAPTQNESQKMMEGDLLLRGFLGVRTLAGNYTLPAGDTVFQVAVMNFEDGKLVSRDMSFQGTIGDVGAREIQPQLLFEPETGKIMLGSANGNIKSASPFWKNLDGGWGSLSPLSQPEIGGFKILAFVSSNLEQGGEVQQRGSGDFNESLKAKKFVGALGIRSAPKPEDLKN